MSSKSKYIGVLLQSGKPSLSGQQIVDLNFADIPYYLKSKFIITFGIFILKEIPNSCHVLNCDNCLIVEVPPPGWSLGDRPALVLKPYFILALMIQGEERRGGQKDKNLDAA